MTKTTNPPLHIVCTACGHYQGTAADLTEAAEKAKCAKCGQPNTTRRTRPGHGRRHHGGLPRRCYLPPDILLEFRQFVQRRARKHRNFASATDHLCVEILSLAGLRAGELVRTRPNPLRFLRIADLHLKGAEPEIEIIEAKAEKSRNLGISTGLRDTIAEYIETWSGGRDYGEKKALIQAYDGTPMSYEVLLGKMAKLSKAFGLERLGLRDKHRKLIAVKPHALRHSFAVDFLSKAQAADAIYHLSSYMGHSSILTTTIYLHTIDKIARKYAEMMQ